MIKAILLIACYLFFSAFLVFRLEAHEVIYLSINSDYENNTGLSVLPFPGRRMLAENRLKSIKMDRILKSPAFNETLHTIFWLAKNSKVAGAVNIAKRIADDFVERGFPLDKLDRFGCSAIKNAIIWKDKDAVSYFLDKNPSVSESSLVNSNASLNCRKSVDELLDEYLPHMSSRN